MGGPILIQVQEIYYPALVLLGVPGNLLAIVILSRGKCGLSKCITRYMVAMATADLLVIIFDVILYEIYDLYFSYTFLDYTPVCSIKIELIDTFIESSVWLTVAFTFDRFIAICCQQLRVKYCTARTAGIIIAIVFGMCFIENIPIFFQHEPLEIINNTAWYCTVESVSTTLPVWAAYFFFDITLTPLAPFTMIFLLNALTIRHIVLASKIRKGLQGNKNWQNHADPEMENRRKSIIMLLAISGCFILLWMVTFVHAICKHFADIPFMLTDYNNPFAIMEHIGYMLQLLSSCTNTIVYAVAQVKFRKELENIITYPLTLLVK